MIKHEYSQILQDIENWKHRLWVYICMLSRVRHFGTQWTITCQAPLSTGLSQQEYWSGFPFTPPGDLPDPGIKPRSPALAGGFFTPEPPGKPESKNSLNVILWFQGKNILESADTSRRKSLLTPLLAARPQINPLFHMPWLPQRNIEMFIFNCLEFPGELTGAWHVVGVL